MFIHPFLYTIRVPEGKKHKSTYIMFFIQVDAKKHINTLELFSLAKTDIFSVIFSSQKNVNYNLQKDGNSYLK